MKDMAQVQVKPETAEEKLARLERENRELLAQAEKLKEQIKSAPRGNVYFKLTQARLPGTNGPTDKGMTTSGRISMYGIQRFPITLGIDGWNRVLAALTGDSYKKFVAENASKFSHKE